MCDGGWKYCMCTLPRLVGWERSGWWWWGGGWCGIISMIVRWLRLGGWGNGIWAGMEFSIPYIPNRNQVKCFYVLKRIMKNRFLSCLVFHWKSNSKFPTFSGFSDNLDLHRSPRSISFRLVEICGRSEKEDLFPVLGNGMSAWRLPTRGKGTRRWRFIFDISSLTSSSCTKRKMTFWFFDKKLEAAQRMTVQHQPP